MMPAKNTEVPGRSVTPPVTKRQNVSPQVLLSEDKLVPLVDGPEIFGAMGKALANAKEYIYLTAWLLHLDTKLGPQSLRQHLLAKAKQGIKVRIILCDLDIVMGKVGPEGAGVETRLAEAAPETGSLWQHQGPRLLHEEPGAAGEDNAGDRNKVWQASGPSWLASSEDPGH
jgi:phosphatidylserine/phosphatidylglycerophosphate/cardiolipin synthase-like enzyme